MAEHPTADRSMGARLAALEARRVEAINAGSQRSVKAHKAKGKMTARERIDYLLDEGSFQEMDLLVRHRSHGMGLERSHPYTDGVVTGFGTIDGRRMCVFSQDFTVFGGALGEAHAEKIDKVMDLALSWECRSSASRTRVGHASKRASSRFTAMAGSSPAMRPFRGGAPESVILGPCAGGAVYSPAITDFIFMVHETSHMFITGPDVVKTVTGEDVTLEQLGGAVSHATRSGVATFVAPDEKACLDEVRYLLSFLPLNNLEAPPDLEEPEDLDAEVIELRDIVPDSPNQPYDMRRVIRAVVDGGEYLEYFPRWAMNLTCGFARIGDAPSGSWATSRACSWACWTSPRRRRAPGSCGLATPSTSRWSLS